MKLVTQSLIFTLITTTFAIAALAEEKTAKEKAAEDVAKLFEPVKVSGGTTTADGFGSLEATLLTTTAVRNAAAKIAAHTAGHGNLLILTDDQAFDYSDLLLVERQRMAVEGLLWPHDAAINAKCPAAAIDDEPVGGAGVALAALAGLIPALQQETKVSSVQVTTTSSALAGAILEERGKNSLLTTYLLNSIANPNLQKTELGTKVIETERRAKCLEMAVTAIPADTEDAAKKELRARMKAGVDAFNEFAKAIATRDASGRMPFNEALRQSVVAGLDPATLRLKVESSGGTTIVRKNFFTLFGANAVGITGGVVVTYTVSEAGTGKVTGGIAACPTGLVDIRAIHNGGGLSASGDANRCY